MMRLKRSSIVLIGIFTASILLMVAVGFSPKLNPKIAVVNAEAISSCLNRVNIPDTEMHWIYVPENASQLHTEENYYLLAGQLITNKSVDASTCPSGGLTLNGYANACGMAVAKDAVIYLQNALDESILNAWKNTGVPPVLLKQMIRTESQFWPSVSDDIHFGYGHITNIGMRNALEWNSRLASEVCPAALGTYCYSNISEANKILDTLVITCPDCKYGVATDQIDRVVNIQAEVVLGYCYQTAQLIFNATGWRSVNVVDYPTIWKLTLMNYNAGPTCVFDAVRDAFAATKGPMKWSDISYVTNGSQCLRGLTYANMITHKFYDFPPAN